MNLADQERPIQAVSKAIDRIKNHGMVIMVDDEDRENEGDLVLAADSVTSEHINFMVKEARGLVCLTLEPEIVDRLNLPMMASAQKISGHGTAFTVSIEARTGVTTGISAHDRARTIRAAIDRHAKPEDLVVPGHIFPLRAKAGGVLERAGHTEGSVDLARLAGFTAAGVICEIMNDDGSMARLPDLKRFAEKFDIPIVAIADLITYRLISESHVEEKARIPLRTEFGQLMGHVFQSKLDGHQHLALVKGHDFGDHPIDVRVQTQSPLLDPFSFMQTSGLHRLEYGLKMLQKNTKGVLLYLTQPSHVDLVRELQTLAGVRVESSLPPVQMDQRAIGIGAQILRSLGVKKMQLHTASPRPLKGLTGFGLEIVGTTIME